ncbi:shikimate dehydrogenase [Leucobacter luti]|uniref:Shikimate dehydrogenase n=1 Tax=Leucobacter luti TaxID=340320 RepID=A0A4R6RV64_9MICO|nr:shikimate dehydrogenase [Leucobacter luti]TDP90195.1 shikimate dehydrogenase [Leucobacter luti]
MPEQLAVLGLPISHSLSPRIHRAAYAQLGLPWRYSAVRCAAAELGTFLAGRGPEWRGLSVTMPLKEEAHRLARSLDPVAESSGVVNTLARRADGRGWDGYNTDVAGLAAAIRDAGLDAARTLVIGTGATAVSAVLAAQQLGAAQLWVAGRRRTAAHAIARRFGATDGIDLADAELRRLPATLVISTLPGPAGHQASIPAELTAVPLFDVAYDPWPSPLAERWRAAGGTAHPGTAMLIEQAIVQVRIFRSGDPTTLLPDESAVRAAMRGATASADMGR